MNLKNANASSIALACAALLTGSAACAQSGTAAAVALFDEGRAALQRGEVDLACAKFKESNRLDPAIGTAFNLANCEEERGRLATAWVLFRQAAARMKTDDPRLSIATARISALESRVPRVIFVADERTPPETRVRVDDIELASASFGSPIPLDPGTHQAIIRSPGVPTRTASFILTVGETVTLPVGTPPPTAAPAERSNQALTAGRVLGVQRREAVLLTGGVGAAAVLVGVVTGVIGLNAEATGDSGCSERTGPARRRHTRPTSTPRQWPSSVPSASSLVSWVVAPRRTST